MHAGLSHEQARFFRATGYFKLLNVLASREIDELKQFIIEARATEEDRRRTQMNSKPVIKLYGLYGRNPRIMTSLITNPVLISALRSLVGPNVVFVTNRHNHATINDSMSTKSEARLHRDILQPTRGLLTVVVYLETSTTKNGCTCILPTSQNLPFVGVPQPNGGGTWMDEHTEYDGLADQALPIPMPEGSMLIFDGLAFHSVGQNYSDRTRMSITLGFRAADELDYHPDPYRHILVAGSYIYRGNDQ